jgi:hypothetical protein
MMGETYHSPTDPRALAPDADATRGALEELDDAYPGRWAMGLAALPPRSKALKREGWSKEARERFGAYDSAAPGERERMRAEHLARAAAHLARGGNLALALPPGGVARPGVVAIDVEDAVTLRACDAADGPWQWSRESEGRAHALYRADTELRQGTLSIDGAPAPVVVRAGGKGYLVAAPSIHPETGEPYSWHRALPDDVSELPELPEAWAAQLRAPRGNGDGGAHASPGANGETVRKGARHPFLLGIAGAMRRKGATRDEILAALRAANLRCEPPKDDAELVKLAGDVAGRYEPAADDGAGIAPVPEAPAWPDPLGEPAYHGLAGEFVRMIEPHTEADPAALLFQFLTVFGSIVGRNRYYAVEGDRHYANLFLVLVGATAKGRKGTSLGHVRRVAKALDPEWQTVAGLSSGEGLIWGARDPIVKREPIRERGRVTGYQEVESDPGVSDKRLLVVETEFASTLRVLGREGNTLSAIVRQAWDTGDLATLTKNTPARATGAHVSIIGHVTADEARRYLDRTEIGNGFGNRLLWACARRSKRLPFGGAAQSLDLQPLTRELRAAVDFGSLGSFGSGVSFDAHARELWAAEYDALSEGRPGLLGALTSRSEAQTVRLALVYALLDRSESIGEAHLRAALACWKYAEQSAACVFGQSLGDPLADRLLELLREAGPDGLTRTEIRDRTGNNRAEPVARALGSLESAGLARRWAVPTGGRPVERWAATESGETRSQSSESSQSPQDGGPADPSGASGASGAPPFDGEPPWPSDDDAPPSTDPETWEADL